MSAAVTAVTDVFKLEKRLLQKQIDELKAKIPSRKDSKFNAKLAELHQTHDDLLALQEKLRDRDMSIEGFQSQLKAWDDSTLGQYVELQKSSIAPYNGTRAVASLYYILLGLRERLEKVKKELMCYRLGQVCSRIVTMKRWQLWRARMLAYAQKLSSELLKQSQSV